MVVLKEFSNMFWGVTLDGGKRYTQTVDKPFNLSMAALESNPDVSDKSRHVQVMLQHESSEFLLCTLGHGNILQQKLDLTFSRGEMVTFFLNGGGVVHLTGSVLEEDDVFADDYDDGDVDSDLMDSDSEAPQLVSLDDSDDEDDSDWEPVSPAGAKRKALEMKGKKNKKMKLVDAEAEDEDDDEDDAYNSSFIDDADLYGEDDDEEDDEKDSDEEEEESDSFMEELSRNSSMAASPSSTKKAKKNSTGDSSPVKNNTKSPKPQGNKSPAQSKQDSGLDASGDATTKKKKKKKKKKNKNKDVENSPGEKPKAETAKESPSPKPSPAVGKKRTVAGGVGVEDLKIGHGPEAKPGKNVSVYYSGILAKNNKRFDSCLKGKPFRVRLGRGEVIKGWDTGLIGMKVGGKRRVTVPPSQGYGNTRQGPIPPGSTLIFDVEMKAVN